MNFFYYNKINIVNKNRLRFKDDILKDFNYNVNMREQEDIRFFPNRDTKKK